MTARSDGGFNAVDQINASSAETARLFGFRSGSGQLHLIGVADDGGWVFSTRKRTLGLPAVGNVSEGWNLQVKGQGRWLTT